MSRILLVDDEQNVLNALRRELLNDYEIETFNSPFDALVRSKEVAFDLVISDYKMPLMNGIQFLKQFGDIQPDAARLILSGQADLDALISAINETHIYRFISKPWDKTELQSCILQALDFKSIIMESRRLANLYRETRTTSESHEIRKVYRLILVDADKVTLTVMSRGLSQDANYEGVHGAMRQEVSLGKLAGSQGFKFVVEAFTTAHAALEHVKHNDFDLVITAQTLPDMDGMQLLAELQKIRPDASRILISNNPDKSLISQAINEAQVHTLLCLYWDSTESNSDITRKTLEVQQLKTAVIQALTSRELLLENKRLAALLEQN